MAVDDAPPPAPSTLVARAYCSLRPVPDAHLATSSASRKRKTSPCVDDEDATAEETRAETPLVRRDRLPPLTPSRVRALFPAVSDARHSHGFAFFENAGGSQAPAFVADAIHAHVTHGFAQLGAGYPQSDRADAMADAARAVARAVAGVTPERLGGTGGDVVIGPSSTQLLANLGRAFDALVGPGDEILVQRASHEANVAPWVSLAKRTGCKLVWWRDADAAKDGDGRKVLEILQRALSKKTKIVAACHVSNLFGGVLDVKAAVKLCKTLASSSCVFVLDSVAFAPHRALRVSEWGVDWCAFSPYKTFGPHCGCLFGSQTAFETVRAFGPNHEFVDPKAHAYKFEPGGVAHETSAGLVGMGRYLRVLSGASNAISTELVGYRKEEDATWKEAVRGERQTSSPTRSLVSGGYGAFYATLVSDCVPSREDVLVAFERVALLEEKPQSKLLSILESLDKRGLIKLFGPKRKTQAPRAREAAEDRVPTFAFVPAVSKTRTVSEPSVARVVAACRGDRHKVAIRSGSMYAVRLCEDLGLDPNEGVVRCSLAHYNTVEEVARLEKALEEVFR
jgi:selenocysteine lyase/cysteine desulfurase